MKISSFRHPIPHLARAAMGALVLAGIAVAAGPALSQETEEVTVTAPREVRQTYTIGRAPATGAPIEVTTISRAVSYADLDLGKTSGAAELRNRINETAKDLCKELDKLYPMEPKDSACVKKAADNAMEQADKAIAAAGK